MANFSVAAQVSYSTGGSIPLSQKKGMPTEDRAMGTAADCAMLNAQSSCVQNAGLLGCRQ